MERLREDIMFEVNSTRPRSFKEEVAIANLFEEELALKGGIIKSVFSQSDIYHPREKKMVSRIR